jgi:hypothetical protein
MPGTTPQPRKAMEIIVESAALYSISALVYIPMIASTTGISINLTYHLYAELVWTYMGVGLSPLSSVSFNDIH